MPRIIPIVITAGIAAAVLSGCGSLPSPQDAVEGAVENAVEDATGSEISVGEDVSLPTGWPDLPLPDGKLLSSFAVDGIYSLDYQVADESAVQALNDALVSAGYELTAESSGEINVRSLTSPDWVASMTWYDAEDLDGVHLLYGVAPNGTE